MAVQKGWTSCPRCQGLHFAGGVCPTDQKPHSDTHSFLYELPFDVAQDTHNQGGWSACPRCQGLYFSESPPKAQGTCPAGGTHIFTGSLAYVLKHDLAPAPAFQTGWRSCSKCLVLYFGTLGGGSKCPKDGQTHDLARSFDYGLNFSPRFVFKEVPTGLDVQLIGDGFAALHPVHIDFGFQTPGLDGVQNDTHQMSDVTTDNLGHFEQQVSMPSNAFNIRGRATDTISTTDSPILREH
jgi:hypothetical protein